MNTKRLMVLRIISRTVTSTCFLQLILLQDRLSHQTTSFLFHFHKLLQFLQQRHLCLVPRVRKKKVRRLDFFRLHHKLQLFHLNQLPVFHLDQLLLRKKLKELHQLDFFHLIQLRMEER